MIHLRSFNDRELGEEDILEISDLFLEVADNNFLTRYEMESNQGINDFLDERDINFMTGTDNGQGVVGFHGYTIGGKFTDQISIIVIDIMAKDNHKKIRERQIDGFYTVRWKFGGVDPLTMDLENFVERLKVEGYNAKLIDQGAWTGWGDRRFFRIKIMENGNNPKTVMQKIKGWVGMDESVDNTSDVKDIFQEYIDEYHMIPKPEDYPFGDIPEGLYYEIRASGSRKEFGVDRYRIIIWCDCDHRLKIDKTKEAFIEFGNRTEEVVSKFKNFGYDVIESYVDNDIYNIVMTE